MICMAISSYQDVDLFRLDAIESIGEKYTAAQWKIGVKKVNWLGYLTWFTEPPAGDKMKLHEILNIFLKH